MLNSERKTINLEETLLSKIPKDCYWEEMGNLTNCPKEYVLDAMREVCLQTLELACGVNCIDHVDEQSILNTIKRVE